METVFNVLPLHYRPMVERAGFEPTPFVPKTITVLRSALHARSRIRTLERV